jgi:5-methylcytosine-specific restriction enzyme subunit McrC
MSVSRKTVRVFEYERLKVGQSCRTTDGGEAIFGETEFDTLVRFNDASARPILTVEHRAVRFSSHVGYIQLPRLGIEILPKADRDRERQTTRWRDALLDMLRVAHGLQLVHSTDANLAVHDANLLECYIRRFVSQVQILLHHGLIRGYRKVQENRSSFRGRLLVTQNLRANLVHAQRMYVEHQVYDHDIIANQTLLAALDLLTRAPLRHDLRDQVAIVAASFPDSVNARIDLESLDRLNLGRNSERYADALHMARLILEYRAPTLRAGTANVLALLFDMNVLWERYITALLRRVTPGDLRVVAQDSRRFWKPHGSRVRSLKPDIVVRCQPDDQVCLVLDTKWKTPSRGQPSDDDLKQMFVYNELYDCNRSLLVYPQPSGYENRDGVFERTGKACGTHFVSLFTDGRYNRQAAAQAVAQLLAGLGDHNATALAT